MPIPRESAQRWGRDATVARGQPRIIFDPEGVRQNCDAIIESLSAKVVSLAGVTKGVAGNPAIAQIMLASGIRILADSRVENLVRLREAGLTAPLMLLRPPSVGGMPAAAKVADIFLMSDKTSLRALAQTCRELGKTAEIILMVDLGDLREGVTPDSLLDLVSFAEKLDAIKIEGIGTNHACHIGAMPDRESMAILSELAMRVEEKLGRGLKFISAGNSSAFDLFRTSNVPSNLNQLRLGEAILLGRETASGIRISGTRSNNFALVAQVIEVEFKNFRASSRRGLNALGRKPVMEFSGERRIALLNVGAIDVEISGLKPLNPALQIIGNSSDHLIIDVTDAGNLSVGDEILFSLNYHALSTAMSSPYLMQVSVSETTCFTENDSNDLPAVMWPGFQRAQS